MNLFRILVSARLGRGLALATACGLLAGMLLQSPMRAFTQEVSGGAAKLVDTSATIELP